ncbi:cyclin-T1 isoform X2 [Parasteatoda tepidariorum]|uniref:cyclin-T1 isoform X2 n=1 Tax=Parasteatoda tepidariorum TaxID=114398 RepID=UPI001C721F06|nr:cyclin-T1 isoform X2 [Parasteatoda tepidariorum]
MEMSDRWYFSVDQLTSTPSRKHGVSIEKEMKYRQHAAAFIQSMGNRLLLDQLCISTAIVFMHRFYMIHSFVEVPMLRLSAAAVFLASKAESQQRRLEHVVKLSHCLINGHTATLDVRSTAYQKKEHELIALEQALLLTLGFDLNVDHLHPYVERICKMVNAGKDLTRVSNLIATNSLHLTNMCLKYKPRVVACFCFHLACKWTNWEIEPCSKGKDWFLYIDPSVSYKTLEGLIHEFLDVVEISPHKLKQRFVQKVHRMPEIKIEESSKIKVEPDVSIKTECKQNGASLFGKVKAETALETKSISTVQSETSPLKLNQHFIQKVNQMPEIKIEEPPKIKVEPGVSIKTEFEENGASLLGEMKSEMPSPTESISTDSKISVKIETKHSISLKTYIERRKKENELNKVPFSPYVRNGTVIKSENLKDRPMELPLPPWHRNLKKHIAVNSLKVPKKEVTKDIFHSKVTTIAVKRLSSDDSEKPFTKLPKLDHSAIV